MSFQNACRSIFSLSFKASHHKGPTLILYPLPALLPTCVYLLSSSYSTYNHLRANLVHMLVPLPDIGFPPQYS